MVHGGSCVATGTSHGGLHLLDLGTGLRLAASASTDASHASGASGGAGGGGGAAAVCLEGAGSRSLVAGCGDGKLRVFDPSLPRGAVGRPLDA